MDNYHAQLEELKENKNYRRLPGQDTHALVDLSSNDYLGINARMDLKEDFFKSFGQELSFSSCSSRLMGKELLQHKLFEEELAALYQREACLLFNSGYHLNTGIIPAIASAKDLIVADKLVHASIIDGAQLSKADFTRYRHLDYLHLERVLQESRNKYRNVLIISESIFSMDGDVADLKILVELKRKYNCLLYIDEAHALGVRGETGLGCCEEQQCRAEIDFIAAPMGKAIASVGAFVICSHLMKDYLVNYSRSLIFSTALPPINVAWSRFVFSRLASFNQERVALRELSTEFGAKLQIPVQSHIIPLILGTNEDTMAKSAQLKAQGFNVLPVRYPTVPKNTARLRFSLSATMQRETLDKVSQIINCQ